MMKQKSDTVMETPSCTDKLFMRSIQLILYTISKSV
jgi:hypothetical protein